MAIPQLNAEQVQDLKNMCGPVDAFSQVVPIEELDKENYPHFMDKVRDTEQLVILGLVEDITDKCSEKLANIYAMTNRLFRVYQITPTGRKMFEGPDRTIQ